jgi:Protein of unknown function (DUF4238)
MSAALTRTTSFTDHWRGQWSDVLHEMEDLEKADPKVKALRIAVPSRRGSSIGIEDVRAMVALTAQVNVTTMVPPLTSILRTMNLTILETNSEPGFITSDAPCVWFDPAALLRPWPYDGHGLASPTIEVFMPVSPRQTALLTWRVGNGYLRVPEHVVMEANRTVRGHCHRSFVVSRNVAEKGWFILDPRAPQT